MRKLKALFATLFLTAALSAPAFADCPGSCTDYQSCNGTYTISIDVYGSSGSGIDGGEVVTVLGILVALGACIYSGACYMD